MLILPEIIVALLLVGSNELAKTQGPERSARSGDRLGEFFGNYYPDPDESGRTTIATGEENIAMRSMTPNQRPRVNEVVGATGIPERRQEIPNSVTANAEPVVASRTMVKPQNTGTDGGNSRMTFSDGETGGGLNFEDEPRPTKPIPTRTSELEDISFGAEPVEPVKCNKSEINYQGKCTMLLKQGPCAADEWLVDIEGKPTCRKTACHYPFIPWNGKCHKLLELRTNNELSGCPKGMVVVLNRDGSSECDCNLGNIYHATTKSCYAAFTLGPCVSGKYFILSPKRGPGGVATKQLIPTCVTNPCGDGKVCYGKNCPFVTASSKSCIDYNSGCTINSKPGLFRVDDNTNTLKCVAIEDEDSAIRAIGNVPPFPCSPGSRRDATGKCRKATTFSFQ